jgi:hypothetical protein
LFEFAVLAALRATQLTRGCRPRVDGEHTVAVMAQLEIAAGAVVAMAPAVAVTSLPAADVAELAVPS